MGLITSTPIHNGDVKILKFANFGNNDFSEVINTEGYASVLITCVDPADYLVPGAAATAATTAGPVEYLAKETGVDYASTGGMLLGDDPPNIKECVVGLLGVNTPGWIQAEVLPSSFALKMSAAAAAGWDVYVTLIPRKTLDRTNMSEFVQRSA